MPRTLVPIQRLTVADVQRRVAAIVEGGAQADELAEFVASVDWSGATGVEPVAHLLGALEHLTEEFAERDISEGRIWSVLGRITSPLFDDC